jgi:very-short-patch-repair endonuclease
MKNHRHFLHYTPSLIPAARRLRQNMTEAERKLWKYLRGKQMQFRFRRQIPSGQYILDFYCPKANLVIEVDGSHHFTEQGMKRDHVRDSYLQQQGLKVLRLSDRDVLMNISGVQQKIYEEIERCLKIDQTPPPSSPKRGGRNR